MLIDLIETNKYKTYEQVYSQYVIEPAHKHADLIDDVEFILNFNKTIQLYLTSK